MSDLPTDSRGLVRTAPEAPPRRCARRTVPTRRLSTMRRTVLRGDYTRLRRRGNRVWVRYRPDEIVWRTSHAFRVEDIHSIKTGVFRFERRRRSRVHGLVPSRVVQSAIT